MIILGLGSNMGERECHLQQALRLLESGGDIRVDQVSAIYDTDPFGVIDQPDFLNMTVSVETKLTPQALLHKCLQVENIMGRIRTQRWGPRVIDIDLLLFNDVQIQSSDLVLPHPGIMERPFVIIPLRDIAPELRLPNGRKAMDMADEFEKMEGQVVRKGKKVKWDTLKKCFV